VIDIPQAVVGAVCSAALAVASHPAAGDIAIAAAATLLKTK
jgi:hypothetical protein